MRGNICPWQHSIVKTNILYWIHYNDSLSHKVIKPLVRRLQVGIADDPSASIDIAVLDVMLHEVGVEMVRLMV